MKREQVFHTLAPVYNEQSRVLILGSIPSPQSRKMQFYYGHPQNRFWRVMAALFHEELPNTREERMCFALRHGIALWDVLESCTIEGASDAAIREPVANDIAGILAQTDIQSVYATGAKAAVLYTKLCQDTTGIPIVKLPSTSPANAAWSFERLCDAYRVLLNDLEKPCS